MQITSYKCPNCSAPVDPGSTGKITCDYCESTLVISDTLVKKHEKPNCQQKTTVNGVLRPDLYFGLKKEDRSKSDRKKKRTPIWIFLIIGVLAGIVGIIIYDKLIRPKPRPNNSV